MSAKYELDGYRPLRPWQRAVSYLGFVIVAMLAYARVQPEMPSLTALGFMVALTLSFCCALFAYWDARVTASLRRNGAKKVRVSGFAQPSFTFFEREDEWGYFSDPEPQLARAMASNEA